MMAKDYVVGHGKPPEHTRFKKGQSGNAKGRPKGAKSTQAILEAELDRTISITENGRLRNVTMRELIIRSNVAKAAKGSLQHARWVQENEPPGAGGADAGPSWGKGPLRIALDMGNNDPDRQPR